MGRWLALILALGGGCGRSQPWDFTGDPPIVPPADAGRVVPDAGRAGLDGGKPGSDAGAPDGGTGCTTLPPSIAPFFETGRPGGGFQSSPGTGQSTTIRVTFPCPVQRVAITVFDPDFEWNFLRAEGERGELLGETVFPSDGTPGRLTQERRELLAPGIRTLLLVPAPGDYVWWDHLEWQ